MCVRVCLSVSRWKCTHANIQKWSVICLCACVCETTRYLYAHNLRSVFTHTLYHARLCLCLHSMSILIHNWFFLCSVFVVIFYYFFFVQIVLLYTHSFRACVVISEFINRILRIFRSDWLTFRVGISAMAMMNMCVYKCGENIICTHCAYTQIYSIARAHTLAGRQSHTYVCANVSRCPYEWEWNKLYQ